MEKPKRTIKKGFKIVEGASKVKKPLAMIALIIASLFAKSASTNVQTTKKIDVKRK